MKFEVLATDLDGRARLGRLHTERGVVDTPAFMPVGTNATVKALTTDEVAATGAQMILANAFHLYLRPGTATIERAGGLHRFMNWSGPILTDSGGFQVFSLATRRSVDDDGVDFRAPFDGAAHRFTPEGVVEIQRALGSDVTMPLDVCIAYPATAEDARAALERTIVWAERARSRHAAIGTGAIFGIVQGGFERALRAEAARRMRAMDFPGYAIGGLSVGEPHDLMETLLEATTPELPEERPRYLMGVGSPPAIIAGIARGVDLFDCALPTRVARTGTILTSSGRVNVRNAKYRDDLSPPDAACECRVCATTTRAYLRHLFHADEMLGPRLATYHNLHFVGRLVAAARAAVRERRYAAWSAQVLEKYTTTW
jgi:queuine tRNA-ribosyltransferase